MNEPKRWLDDGASEQIGRLLRAASDEQPSATALERAVAGVTVGAGVTGAAVGSASASIGAAAKGAPLASGIFLKWTLLGSLVTLGAGGLVTSLSSFGPDPMATPARLPAGKPDTLPSEALTPVPQEQPVVRDSGGAQNIAPSAQSGLGGEVRRPSSSTKGPPTPAEEAAVVDVELLGRETKLVDRARAELGAGRAGPALVILNEYQAQFPSPRYAPEALYLRMEALLAQGNQQAARQVAKRLASSYPQSPHAARAEALLSTTIP
jgi:hypothetical protein